MPSAYSHPYTPVKQVVHTCMKNAVLGDPSNTSLS